MKRIVIGAAVLAFSGLFVISGCKVSKSPGGTGDSPEINIQLSGIDIPQGTTGIDIGGTTPGAEISAVFTIQNTGEGDLEFTGTPVVTLSGDNEFSVSDDAPGLIRGLEDSSFEVSFLPVAEGTYAADISIANSDDDENPYSFSITGTCTVVPEPEMNIQLSGSNIADGAAGIDIGTLYPAESNIIIFTIQNSGSAALSLSGVTLIGDSEFSINADTPASVAAGSSDTFALDFAPAAAGTYTASISIDNNDTNENPYNFTIKGTCIPVPAPEMNIQFSGSDIGDEAAGIDVGTFETNSGNILTFTIQNTGSADLNISGSPAVVLSGDPEFTLNADAPSLVASGVSETFSLLFSPASSGAYGAGISIVNNDSDENPYNFTISAVCVDAPEMEVEYNAAVVDDGTADLSLGDLTLGSSDTFSFTVNNTGTTALNLAGTAPYVLVSGTGFSLNTDLSAATVDGGFSDSFVIQFDATACGVFTGGISIVNNDSDENPYDFTVQVNVVPNAPVISLDSADDTFGVGTSGTDTDGLTSISTGLTINGTADPDAQITLFKSVTEIGSVTADGLGVFSCDIDLDEGSHSITAVATLDGIDSVSSALLTITVDMTAPSFLPDMESADKIVVYDMTSLSTASIFTSDSDTAASYTGSANPYTVTLSNKAGNTISKPEIYITAAGIKSAVETITTDTIVYIAQEQTYSLGAGNNKEIAFTNDIAITLKGISTNVIIDFSRSKPNLSTVYFNSAGTLYLDTLSLSMSGSDVNLNAVGNNSTDNPSGTVYLKNIKKDSLNDVNTELIDIYEANIYYWNGTDWTQVTATGNGWTVTVNRKTFAGTETETYWQ